MSSIADIASQISPPVQGTGKSDPSSLGKSDFLNLLVAQMKNQDPLNPEDPTQYMSQLTQYSSLEQLINVNDNLTNMSSSQSLNSMASAAAYIGKTATVTGNTFTTTAAGAPTTLHYNVPRAAADATLTIADASGATVRSVDLGNVKAGDLTYGWDGKTDNGAVAPAGIYQFSVAATDTTGSDIPTTPSVTGLISGVKFNNGTAQLEIGGIGYDLNEVTSITN